MAKTKDNLNVTYGMILYDVQKYIGGNHKATVKIYTANSYAVNDGIIWLDAENWIYTDTLYGSLDSVKKELKEYL